MKLSKIKKITVLTLCALLLIAVSGCGVRGRSETKAEGPANVSAKPSAAGSSNNTENGNTVSALGGDEASEDTGSGETVYAWQSEYSDPLDIPADIPDTEALKARAAAMQDYSHPEGEDAEPVSIVDDNVLLLVNKTHPLSSDYKAGDMVKVDRIVSGVGTDETHQMRALAAEHLNEMFDAAKEDGYDIRLRTGYRSYSYQKQLFDSYAANHGREAANRYSALPGESEHQSGWCCDVGLEGVSLSGFTGTPEAQWIVDHAHEYGFILRYPEEKEDITGYIYESWHIRYVGVEAATEIHERNITLEEYLGVID